MKKIKLTQGKTALVDNKDFEFLNQLKWKYSKEGYAVTWFKIGTRKQITVGMHRLIMNPFTELIVDHKDNNPLNNQRNNLRICYVVNNTQNRSKTAKIKTSKFKGVSFHKRTKKWQARIGYKGRTINLGMFSSEEQASSAYEKAAAKYFGKFAWKKFR